MPGERFIHGRCPFIPAFCPSRSVCLSVCPSLPTALPGCGVFGSAASPWAAPLHPRSLQTSPLVFPSRNHNFHPLKSLPRAGPPPLAVNEWLVAV